MGGLTDGRIMWFKGEKWQAVKKEIASRLLRLHLGTDYKVSLFYYLIYFYCYLRVTPHFLVLFMSLTVPFQLAFIFIYSTFSKKILISAK